MVKMAEWPGDTGSLGEWAQEQLDLLGASEAAMYGADLEDGQHLWVAADVGLLHIEQVHDEGSPEWRTGSVLHPWSEVRGAGIAFTKVVAAQGGWQATVHIAEPAFSESRWGGPFYRPLIDFGMNCIRRSEAFRRA